MYEVCRHIKTSGTRCGSPALTGKAYCYFHLRTHQLRHRPVDHYSDFVSYNFDVAVLEDRAAIQLAISEVVSAMARHYMDAKRGGKILYGLQLALQGIKHPEEILAPSPVRDLCQNAEGEDIAPEKTVDEEAGTPPENRISEAGEPAASGTEQNLVHNQNACELGSKPPRPRASRAKDPLQAAVAKYIAELQQRRLMGDPLRRP